MKQKAFFITFKGLSFKGIRNFLRRCMELWLRKLWYYGSVEGESPIIKKLQNSSKDGIPLKLSDFKIQNLNIERNFSIKILRVMLDEHISWKSDWKLPYFKLHIFSTY